MNRSTSSVPTTDVTAGKPYNSGALRCDVYLKARFWQPFLTHMRMYYSYAHIYAFDTCVCVSGGMFEYRVDGT